MLALILTVLLTKKINSHLPTPGGSNLRDLLFHRLALVLGKNNLRRQAMNNYSEYEQEAIRVALSAIHQTLTNDDVMNSPEEVQNYRTLKLADEPDEWFGVMYLTSQHRLIRFERLFRGTINASQVHVRVIARKALELNAAALILAHNHPSGIAEPSGADQRITTNIKDAMEVFDVKVLDHFIVSPDESCSFAMRGML